MRELADILSCEYSLVNCDFDRAAKKAVLAQYVGAKLILILHISIFFVVFLRTHIAVSV